MDKLTYADYLLLTPLLDLQQLRTTSEDAEVRSSEHFFIVVHQSTELWLKQIGIDLRLAIEKLGDSHPDSLRRATTLVGRANATFNLLIEHLELLSRHLTRENFFSLRVTLGSASGLQSAQFRDLSHLLGVQVDGDGPLLSAFLTRVENDGQLLESLFAKSARSADPHREVADALLQLGNTYYQWLVAHLMLVSGMIGIDRGTGGTSGVEFLLRRLKLPFPRLREAVTAATA